MGPRGQKRLLNLIHTLLVIHGYHHSTLQYLSIEVFYDHICSNIAFTLFGTLFWRSTKGASMGKIGALKLSFYIPICYNSTQYLSLKVSHDYLCKYLTFTLFWSLFCRSGKRVKREGSNILSQQVSCLKDLWYIILLFNTFQLRYYIAIHVNILI